MSSSSPIADGGGGASGGAAEDDPRELVRALRRKHEVTYEQHSQKTSCGMVLESTLRIRRIIPGGPLDRSFGGCPIEEDDLLLAIDGSACVPDTVQKALVGEDVVGSKLRLTIEKAADGRVLVVTVKRGSYARMLAIGELFLMFKQLLSDLGYGNVVTAADLLKLEDQCVKVVRVSSEHLEKLRCHVVDLEKLVLGLKRKAALAVSATQTEALATSAHETQTPLVTTSAHATQTKLVTTSTHATQVYPAAKRCGTQTEARAVLVQETQTEREEQAVMIAQEAQTESADRAQSLTVRRTEEKQSQTVGSHEDKDYIDMMRNAHMDCRHKIAEFKRVRKTFTGWVWVLLLSKQYAAATRHIALNSRRKCLALHVNTWRCQSVAKRLGAALKRAAVKAFVRRVTTQTLWTWRAVGMKCRLIVHISRTIQRFWRSWYEATVFATLRSTFVAWKANVNEIQRDRMFLQEQRRRNILLKRVARRWCLRSQSRAFAQWRHHFTANIMHSVAANKIQTLSKIKAQMKALDGWWIQARTSHVVRRLWARQASRAMHATWKAWEVRMEEERRLHAGILKTVFRWQHANCAQAFVKWEQETIHQQKLRETASNAARALSLTMQTQTLVEWREYVRRCRIVSKVTARWKGRWVLAACSAWQMLAVEARRIRRAGLAVCWQWKRREISAAWHTWSDQAHAAKCVRRSANTVMRRWLHLRIGAAFASWKAEWKKFVGLAQLTTQIKSRWQYVCGAAVISTWHIRVLETRRLQRCAQSVMRRWLHLRAGDAFARWKVKMLHRRRLLLAVMQIRRCKQPILAGPFDAWKSGALEGIQMAHVNSQVVRRWKHLSMSQPFLKWVAKVRHDKRLACAMKKVLSRRTLISFSSRFGAWAAKMADTKQMKHRAATVIARMRSINLSSSWRAWVVHTREQTRCEFTRRQKISAIRWMHISEFCQSSILRDSFHAWSRRIQEQHARLRALRRTSEAWDLFITGVGRARRMRKVVCSLHIRRVYRLLKPVFEAWFRCVDAQEACSARNAAWNQRRLSRKMQEWAWIEWHEHLRQRRVVAKVAGRWRSSAVSASWTTWQRHTAEVRLMKRTAIKAAWNQRRLSRKMQEWAWIEWHEHLRQRRVVAKVAGRWRSSAVSASWTTWQMHAAEVRRIRRIGISVCQTWRQRQLGSAWKTWYDYHVQRGRVSHLRKGIVTVVIACVFSSWKRQAKHRKVLAAVARKVVVRWQHFRLRLPLFAWRERRDSKGRQQRAARAVARLQKMQVISAPFDTWIRYVLRSNAVRAVLQKRLKKLRSKTWFLWLGDMLEKQRLRLAADKVLARWMGLQASQSWNGWRFRCAENHRVKRITAHIIRRWSQRWVASLFEAWKTAHLEFFRNKLSASRIILRWRQLNMSTAFSLWVDKVAMMRSAGKLLLRWQGKSALAAFNVWCHSLSEQKRAFDAVHQLLARQRHRKVARGFTAFADFWVEQSSIRCWTERMLARVPGDQIARAFERWVDQWELWRHLQEEKHQAFKRWAKQLFDVREQCTRVVDRFVNITMQRYVAQLFDLWADNVRERSEQRLSYQRIIRHFTLTASRITFDMWKDFVCIAKKEHSSKMVNRSKMTSVAAVLLALWTSICLRTAMQMWVKNVSLLSRSRAEMKLSIDEKSRRARQSWAFLHWTLFHRNAIERQRLSDKVINRAVQLHRRWKLMLPHELFSQWAGMMAASRQLRAVAMLVLTSCQQNSVASAFNGWKEKVSTGAQRDVTRQEQAAAAVESEEERGTGPEDRIPLVVDSTELNPPEPDTWWSNMQRNMSVSELRLGSTPDRQQRAIARGRSGQGQARLSPPQGRFGQLRFREATTEL